MFQALGRNMITGALEIKGTPVENKTNTENKSRYD